MTAPVGRPRLFDLPTAVRTAQSVFWQHGYEATSLAMLAKAIGVHKPSLYAAYGDKRALYLEAYDAYQRDSGKLVVAALSRPHLRNAIGAFFEADIDLFTSETGTGCFMLATALPLAGTDLGIADRVRMALSGLRTALLERFERAANSGELTSRLDAESATDLALSVHIALANRARSGEPRAALEASARRLTDVLCAI